MMNKIDFDADDAVTTVKLKDGTEIRVKFIISAVLYAWENHKKLKLNKKHKK